MFLSYFLILFALSLASIPTLAFDMISTLVSIPRGLERHWEFYAFPDWIGLFRIIHPRRPGQPNVAIRKLRKTFSYDFLIEFTYNLTSDLA